MNCERMKESLLDVATGRPVSAEVEEHLRECAECHKETDELRATLAVMDEWPEVEPSPYFDARLQARLREEKARAEQGWWAWLRRPVLAGAFVLLVAVGVGLFQRSQPGVPQTQVAQQQVRAATPTLAADLQTLDRNEDLYANFDVLDTSDDAAQVQ